MLSIKTPGRSNSVSHVLRGPPAIGALSHRSLVGRFGSPTKTDIQKKKSWVPTCSNLSNTDRKRRVGWVPTCSNLSNLEDLGLDQRRSSSSGQVLRCAPWGLHGVPGEDGPRAGAFLSDRPRIGASEIFLGNGCGGQNQRFNGVPFWLGLVN